MSKRRKPEDEAAPTAIDATPPPLDPWQFRVVCIQDVDGDGVRVTLQSDVLTTTSVSAMQRIQYPLRFSIPLGDNPEPRIGDLYDLCPQATSVMFSLKDSETS